MAPDGTKIGYITNLEGPAWLEIHNSMGLNNYSPYLEKVVNEEINLFG